MPMMPSAYPLAGIGYLVTHPQLLSNLICPILLTLIWSIGMIIFGFSYLYKKQAFALIAINCPPAVAWIVCFIFVLLEVAVLTLLFYLILLPIYQDRLFDRVLKLRGFRHVLKQNEGNDCVKCLRGVHGGLLVVFFQIMVLIITLPLNLIPILGQVLFATINGWVFTFAVRFHYDAEIRDISVNRARKEAWQRKRDYTRFGSVAVGLEMVPLANLVFLWTNVIGAALWVADELEKAERLQQEQTQGLMPHNNNHGLPPNSQQGAMSSNASNAHNQGMIPNGSGSNISQGYTAQVQPQHPQFHVAQDTAAPPPYSPVHMHPALPMGPVSGSNPFAHQGQVRIPPPRNNSGMQY